MFSIGPLEAIIIMIVALVIVGPEKLPEMARMAARALRDLRKYANDVRREFERDTQEIKEDLKTLTHDTVSDQYPYSGTTETSEGEPYQYDDEGRYEDYKQEGGDTAQEEETPEESDDGSSDSGKPDNEKYPPD